MHIPDGFVDAPTAIGAGVLALGGIAFCLRKAERDLDDRLVPMAGLAAAFIFAAQMLNFPIAAGTSGHLLGGALAAMLVGPYVGAVALTVVLAVQAVLFADGGISALGLNVINMALVTCFVGYGLFQLLARVVPKTVTATVIAGGIAAGLSVPIAATVFTVEYAIGGAVGIDLATLAGAMVGVHTLIGIGEGLITAVVLGSVLAVRPDLARAGSRLLPSAGGSPSPGVVATPQQGGTA